MSKRFKLAALATALLGALTASLLFAMLHGDHSSLKLSRLDTAQRLLKDRDALERNSPTLPGVFDNGREASRGPGSAAQETYDNQAFPATRIAFAQVQKSATAAKRIIAKAPKKKGGGGWQSVGPSTLNVDPLGTQTYGTPTQWSGRETALAVGVPCNENKCKLYMGAAGGGVWKTDNALDKTPEWTQISDSFIGTNAIGSILVDPTNAKGKRIYVGTGEPNGSGDSEDGIGLFKSSNSGKTWKLIPASVEIAKGRAIGAIAVDPSNPSHLLIGTDVARHGLSSNSGGRFTPPDAAPIIGLYESFDGGDSWNLAFNLPQDPVNPTSANGSDFFTGGVTKIQFDPTNPSMYYFSMTGYGLFRFSAESCRRASKAAHKTCGNYENIFYDNESPEVPLSLTVRFEFAAVDNGLAERRVAGKPAPVHCTRIYLGAGWNEGGPNDASQLYRADCANLSSADYLTNSQTDNAGWNAMSSGDDTDPGFGSFDFCEGQCDYDMWVASPPGHPNTVLLGGSMEYAELILYGGADFSNGRAVVMSTDGGQTWTDMTGDASFHPSALFFPWEDMHPDQHAVAFDPANPDIMFFGSDGGLVRTNGKYKDNSGDCYSGLRSDVIGQNLTNCLQFLSKIPDKLITLNAGLNTLQFQSLSIDPSDPLNNVLGGTQDNGTLAYSGSPTWFLGITGDGGDSGIDPGTFFVKTGKSLAAKMAAKHGVKSVVSLKSRSASGASPSKATSAGHKSTGGGGVVFHTYTGVYTDENFNGALDPTSWVWTSDPFLYTSETAGFYAPMLQDPVTSGQIFAGLDRVWRTQDSGGDPDFLYNHCNTTFVYGGSDAFGSGDCGDWQPLGSEELNSSFFGGDKFPNSHTGNYVVALGRGWDSSLLWAGTRRGRIFVSPNADTSDPGDVEFFRVDGEDQPTRFPSGIAVVPFAPDYAFITYSSYNAYADAAGTAEGHIFLAHVDTGDCSSTACATDWQNLDYDIGDTPVLDVAYDGCTDTVYVSTDFGVFKLVIGDDSAFRSGDLSKITGSWVPAAPGLPLVATYGLTLNYMSDGSRVLYAATHGRGAYRLTLPKNGCIA
jgi:hypothetical protein